MLPFSLLNKSPQSKLVTDALTTVKPTTQRSGIFFESGTNQRVVWYKPCLYLTSSLHCAQKHSFFLAKWWADVPTICITQCSLVETTGPKVATN